MKPALPALYICIGMLMACCFHPMQICFAQQVFTGPMLQAPREYAQDFEKIFRYSEVPVYVKNNKEKSVFLKNAYASAEIKTPVAWPVKTRNYYVTEVRIIFTKYPVDKTFWNTNYYDLLAQRLRSVFEIDPRLNDSSVTYSLVLQTGCTSADEAKSMFHGIEIVYETDVKNATVVDKDKEIAVYDTLYEENEDSLSKLSTINKALKYFEKTNTTDTVVLSGLARYANRDSLLIVIDCTGSMAPYYTQVSLWAARNFYPGHYYVLYNDAGDRSLPMGESGGYLHNRVKSANELMKMLKKATSVKGKNKEVAENVIEGLLEGIRQFPDNKSIVLVADNMACIRDYKLMDQVTQPVHIICCGGYILNPHYMDLAMYTGGSIYWQRRYYDDWKTMCNGSQFEIGDGYYRFSKKNETFAAFDYRGNEVSYCPNYKKLFKKKK